MKRKPHFFTRVKHFLTIKIPQLFGKKTHEVAQIPIPDHEAERDETVFDKAHMHLLEGEGGVPKEDIRKKVKK